MSRVRNRADYATRSSFSNWSFGDPCRQQRVKKAAAGKSLNRESNFIPSSASLRFNSERRRRFAYSIQAPGGGEERLVMFEFDGTHIIAPAQAEAIRMQPESTPV